MWWCENHCCLGVSFLSWTVHKKGKKGISPPALLFFFLWRILVFACGDKAKHIWMSGPAGIVNNYTIFWTTTIKKYPISDLYHCTVCGRLCWSKVLLFWSMIQWKYKQRHPTVNLLWNSFQNEKILSRIEFLCSFLYNCSAAHAITVFGTPCCQSFYTALKANAAYNCRLQLLG